MIPIHGAFKGASYLSACFLSKHVAGNCNKFSTLSISPSINVNLSLYCFTISVGARLMNEGLSVLVINLARWAMSSSRSMLRVSIISSGKSCISTSFSASKIALTSVLVFE